MRKNRLARLLAFVLLLSLIMTAIPVTAGADAPLDSHLKVLFVGNSYCDDATDGGYFPDSMLYRMLKSMAGDRSVTLGLVYEGSKTLGWYASAADSRHPVNFHLADRTPYWSYIGANPLDSILSYTDWDIVVFQPYGAEMSQGTSPGFNDGVFKGEFTSTAVSLPYLLDLVASKAPTAEAYLYLPFEATTSTEIVTNRNDFSTYATQMGTLETYRGTSSSLGVTKVIPVGTAVQTARSTYLATLSFNKDVALNNSATPETDPQLGLQRDPVHLSFSIGRYLANLVTAETIIPVEERAEGYTLPEMRESAQVGRLPSDYADLIRIAATEAHSSASTAGRARYLPTILTGYTVDPLVTARTNLEGTELIVREGADENELKALISTAVRSATDLDTDVTVDLKSEYTVPEVGGETAVLAEITVAHGYSGDFTVSRSVTVRQGYSAYVPEFDDVEEDDWFYDSVIYAASKGYMKGTNSEMTLFSPDMEFTREQFVQLLFNMEGLDKADYSGDTGFSDVESGKWYSAAVKWAKLSGVTSGIGDNLFGLGGKVTREQLAMFLKNYAEMKGLPTAGRASLSLDIFSDGSSVSGWARDAVSFAVAEGLLGSTSVSEQVLSPGRVAMRSEIARVTMTFDAYLAK